MLNKKGFSVGEMMVVLLVLSIILAASMPVITKRSRSSSDTTWHAAQNNVDTYFNAGTLQGVVIGGTSFPNNKYAKLLLNIDEFPNNTDLSHLILSVGGTATAKLRVTANQFEFGKDADAANTNATAIGQSTSAGTNGTAVGNTANANATDATSFGYKTEASTNATAVGSEADASSNYATAIGSKAESTGVYSTSLGYESSAGANSLALGYGATAGSTSSVALGNDAKANGNFNIALGYNAVAGGASATYKNYATAIGPNTTSDVDNQMNIGTAFGDTATKYINIGYKQGLNATAVNLIGVVKANGNEVETVDSSSDKRLKNIIGEYKSGLNEITKIKTYEFTYKDDLNKRTRVGVIAQELQTILPKAVSTDNKGYLKVKKEDILYAMVNAIKELNTNYISLKKENAELKQQIEELSKRIDKLEQRK